MDLKECCIATVTLSRNPREEAELKRALKILKNIGAPVVVTDGGSKPQFIDFLLQQNFLVRASKTKGLVPQVKESLRTAARECSTPFILYTEPDKLPFFQNGLVDFVKAARSVKNFGVALAARDPRSFQTFPKFQQRTESAMSELTELLIGTKGDYCYGPFLMTTDSAKVVLDAPDHLGWGWRFFLFGRIHKTGMHIQHLRRSLPCPRSQRRETKPDRIYRLKQLRQNLEGLFLGFEDA